jgi:hypothetical protein
MVLPLAVEQVESLTELGMETLWTVPHHLQPAAPGRPFRPEARHDDMAPGPYYALHLRYIAHTVPRVSKEVKDGTIVPQGGGRGGQWDIQRICHDPPHPSGAFCQAFLGPDQSCLCQVQNRDFPIAPVE